MKTIDILGSCVTRDTFRFPNNGKYKLGNYFARSSIISLYSNPIALKLDDIQLASAFQKRMVYYDLTKAFPSYLKTASSDYLVIDFIDERIRVTDGFICQKFDGVNCPGFDGFLVQT